MKKFVKLTVGIIGISIIFSSHSISAEKILPLPKPVVDQSAKIKNSKSKEIYPKKRPGIKLKKKVEKNNNEKNIKDIDATKEIKMDEVFIYPKKKPITVTQKVDKVAIKSSVFSKKDFKIAKDVFKAIDKKKWQTALKLSIRSKDKSLNKLVNYLY